jgi:hypothetical protein
LRIVTIYFLGFNLNKEYPAVAKIKGVVEDVVSGQTLPNRPKEPFVDLLTHESYVIQIARLENRMQTQVEDALSVFDQRYRTLDDSHLLEVGWTTNNPLVTKMVDRLCRAVANPTMRQTMNIEDEIDRVFSRALKEKDKIIAEKDQVLAEKESVIAEKDQVLAEKENLIAEKERQIAELLEKLNRKE